jgi:hypothetical protein
MFNKFSRSLIIFAFAISLTGLSETENAQGCGSDPSVKSVGGGDGSFKSWVEIWAEDSHLESNLFVGKITAVEQGCVVCQDPENIIPPEILTTVPVTVEPVFTPALFLPSPDPVTGNIEVVETMCDTACGTCEGKINFLTLQYNALSDAYIIVKERDIVQPDIYVTVFDGPVEAGAEFDVPGEWKKDTLGPNLKIYVGADNESTEFYTTIDTSCSDNETTPRSGREYGDFEVVTSFSRIGGLLCPLDPDASTCTYEEFALQWGLFGEPPVEGSGGGYESASAETGADCETLGLITSKFHVQKVYLTGNILMGCDDPEDPEDPEDPVNCIEVDKMCVYCWTYEECETWKDDGRVDYICEEIPCHSPVE